MKRAGTYFFIVAVIFSIAFVSCKKYPDGPSFSLRSKKERISNTWNIEQYKFNGADSTSFAKNHLFNNYKLIINKNGEYSFNYVLSLGTIKFDFNETGTWTFSGDKKNVIFTKATGNTTAAAGSIATWEILKLKEKEFWAKYIQDGDVTEVHFN